MSDFDSIVNFSIQDIDDDHYSERKKLLLLDNEIYFDGKRNDLSDSNNNNNVNDNNNIEEFDKLINISSNDNSSNENNNGKNKFRSKLIYFTDSLISAIIFGPICGFYWYGTWTFLDVYFIPNNVLLSALICYLFGLLVLLPGYVFQINLQRLHNKLKPKMQVLFRILFIYLVSFAIVMEWRGCWVLLDKYLVMDWKGQLSLSIIAISYMLIARSFYYVLSPPFVLLMDTNYDDYFLVRSRYRFKSIESTYVQHSFDFIISELIESFAAIISWRGIAYTIDFFLFPNDLLLSALATAIISHLIYFILVITQYYIYSKAINLQLIPRLVIEDTIKLLMFISIILIWRFYWIIIDNFLYVKEYRFELFLSFHFLSFILSLLLNASIVITGPACEFKDGELNDDKSYFYIYYFATLINKKNNKNSNNDRNRRYFENQIEEIN